jgi:transposase InsO family protein
MTHKSRRVPLGRMSEHLSPPYRWHLRTAVSAKTERIALRAVLTAARLLGLAAGVHLRQLRSLKDPLGEAQSLLQQAQLQAQLAWEIIDMLLDRFGRIPERKRPHYRPHFRFRALEIKNLFGWSRIFAARVFLVCPNTISNWERSADPVARMVGSTLEPVPPVRRFADTVRSTVQLMVRAGFGGEDMVAQTLARAGWRLSARSVRRIAAERPLPPPPLPPERRPHPVVARFVHHVWMMDITEVPAFLGVGTFHVAGVFDAFSRVPVALRVFDRNPGAPEMARLLRAVARRFGSPRYLITDLGGEFGGRVFARAVGRLGVRQRFASAENLYATARLERFWRTLKDTARLRRLRPLTFEDLERRLTLALTHYLLFRPHQGLRGATPAEAYLGIEPESARAESPPRGRRGEGSWDPALRVGYLDPQTRSFPILKTAA